MTDWLRNASPDVRALNADLFGESDRATLTPEQGAEPSPEEQAWASFRDAYLTPYGWRFDSPGVYVHDETAQEFHPFRQWAHDGIVYTAWQLYAQWGETPDPEMTHTERRRHDWTATMLEGDT